MDPLLVTLANFTSDAHLVAHVEMLFQTLDTDDSQSLSYDELRAGLSKMDFDPPIRLSIEDWQQFTNHGASLAEALQRGVQLARTGKVVELAASRPASASSAREIRGVTGGYHLGEYREQAGSAYQGTGIFVFRADSFLVEAEILCGDMLALCREALSRGQISAPVSDGSLDSLATLSFWNGFWTRTDNRAAIVIGEQPETVSIPATGLATVERRRVQR